MTPSSLYTYLFPSYIRFNKVTSIKRSLRMDEPVQWTPDSPQFRREICLALWDFDINQTPLPYAPTTLEAFFRYYIQQADLFMHDAGQHVLTRTHEHVLEICRILKDNLDYKDVQDRVQKDVFKNKSYAQNPKAFDSSVDLVVRLMLMVEMGSIPNGFSGNFTLAWEQGKLSQGLSKQFSPHLNTPLERVRLGRVFTARNLERIAGIKIVWTNNLLDHLRLFDSEDGEILVNVFHHASFLMIQQQR